MHVDMHTCMQRTSPVPKNERSHSSRPDDREAVHARVHAHRHVHMRALVHAHVHIHMHAVSPDLYFATFGGCFIHIFVRTTIAK